MTKSFKKFREEWDTDEWGSDDDDNRRKDRKLESRRQQRREKVHEKYSKFDDNGDE